MISMFQKNGDIQKKEVNTARKINIPILFIYNSKGDKRKNGSVNSVEDQIFFEDINGVAIILKNKFRLIEEVIKNLPFKTLKNHIEVLTNTTNVNSFSLLKDEKKLILTGYEIMCITLVNNSKEILNIGYEGKLIKICVNYRTQEIIILNNRVFSKYDFDFEKP